MKKSLLITGASRGIGAATALLAAKEGYQVYINYLHNEEAARKVAATIVAQGGKAVIGQADVAEEKEVIRLFNDFEKQLGQMDGLVNNAGILERQSRVDEITEDRLVRVFKTNSISYFLCAREAVKRMSTRYGGQGGAIVNVSSIASRTGSPGEYVDYAASKAANDALTIGLAKEVADEGIRVNGVRPGFIYTDIHASGGEPGRVDRLASTIPMKRGGQPEEIAHAILWLLSDKSSFCTGTIIEVTGGR